MKRYYHNRVAELNLASGSLHVRPLFDADSPLTGEAQDWPGGAELGRQLAENTSEALVLTTGPLTGSFVPASGGLCLTLKTAAGLSHATVSGHHGVALRRAGFDALILAETASEPCVAKLSNGFCRLVPVRDLPGLSPQVALERQRSLLARSSSDDAALLLAGPAAFAGSPCAALASDTGLVAGGGSAALFMASRNLTALVLEGDGPLPPLPVQLDNPARAAVLPKVTPKSLEDVLTLLFPAWQGPLPLTTGRAMACHHCPSPCRFWLREKQDATTPWVPCSSHEALHAVLGAPRPLDLLRLCDRWGLDPVRAAAALAPMLAATEAPVSETDLTPCLDALTNIAESPQSAANLTPEALSPVDETALKLGVCPLFVRRHPEVVTALADCLSRKDS